MFRLNAQTLRADAERVRQAAAAMSRTEDASDLRRIADGCDAAAAALEAQSRQLATGAAG